MGKTVILVALALSVGFFTGKQWSPAATQGNDLLKSKFQNLADHELTDYYRLKTLEEKYQKADEILGKILLIFLADLGLRINPDVKAAAKHRSMEVIREIPKPAISEPVVQKKVSETAPELRKESKRAWLSAERALGNVRQASEIGDFLEKTKIENFDQELKQASRFTNEKLLQSLQGRFSGIGQVKIDDRIRDWNILFSLLAVFRDGQVNGDLEVRIQEGGQVISNQKDGGTIRALRSFSDGSEAVLVRIGPKRFMQAYYLPTHDEIIGNLYHRPVEGEKSDFLGTFVLQRVR